MEGEQKFSIPLDSPLDINSNDMFVPAQSPKFSFNRQRFLGSVLQNSVRYEADGWFAGWWVHNFDLVSLGTIEINPDTLGFPTVQAKLIPGQLIEEYWIVSFQDVKLQFRFSPIMYTHWISGSGTVNRTSDTVIHIEGKTTKEKTFSVDCDPYTGATIPGTESPNDGSLEFSGYQSNGLYYLTVKKPQVLGNDMIMLRFGSDLVLYEENFRYGFDGTKHTWGDLIIVTGDVMAPVITHDYELVDYTLVNAHLENEYFDVHLKTYGVFTFDDELTGIYVGCYDYFSKLIRSTDADGNYVDDMDTEKRTATDMANLEGLGVIAKHPDPIVPVQDAWMVAEYHIPIWLKLSQLYDATIDIALYERVIVPPTVTPEGVTIINSYANCQIYLTLSRKNKSCIIQNVIDMGDDVRFEVIVDGNTYSDAQMPITIPIGDRTTTKAILDNASNFIPVTIRAVNNSADTNYPVPANYIYSTITFTIEYNVDQLKWINLPPPPPLWLQEDGRGSGDAHKLWQWTDPTMSKPSDWTNPVAYPIAWPTSVPAAWVNPYQWLSPWPAKPDNWANPVVAGSVEWPAAAPTDWDTLYPYPPPGFNVGEDVPPSQWHSASITYSDFIASLKPTNWPIMLPWPTDVWTPPWPPNWVFGVLNLPANEWFTTPAYNTWLAAIVNTIWPITMEWPFTLPSGYEIRTPADYTGTLNTTQPDTWTPPWPPQWPYGILGLPASDWFIGAQTYEQYLIELGPPDNWPIPWATPLTWPLTASSGWEPRTGTYPHNWVINTVAPDNWTPDWPINWPYGITFEPPGWYSAGTSYIDYVTAHIPYRAPAADFSTGGDPGFVWPGHTYDVSLWTWNYPQPTEPAAAYPSDVGDPKASYNPDTGAVTWVERPANWPYYNVVHLQLRGTNTSLVIGNDIIDDVYNYTVLNRTALDRAGIEDKHLFSISPDFVAKSEMRVIFPLCVFAYTVYRINTVDITLNVGGVVKEAFTVNIVSNVDVGKKLFRLDDCAKQAGYERYSLDSITPTILAVTTTALITQLVPVPVDILIGYNLTGNFSLDKVIDYNWPERGIVTDPLPNIQNTVPVARLAEYGFYPSWITPSDGGSNYWIEYTLDKSSIKLSHTAVAFISFVKWLNGRQSNITYTPENGLNADLAATLRGGKFTVENAPGKAYPWAVGVFSQTMYLEYDILLHYKIEITYNVLLMAAIIQFDPSDTSPWEVVGTPSLTYATTPREKFTLSLVLKRGSDVYITLKRAFIVSQNGLMAAATMVSATQSLITLNDIYGNVDRNALWRLYDQSALELVKSSRGTDTVTLYVGENNNAEVHYLPIGIFQSNKPIQYVSYTGGTLTFIYESTTYTLRLGNDVTTRLKFSVTDIRNNEIREIASLDTRDIFMAVKQFWSNDVDVENFWWIDDTHVLALTKYELVLFEKTNELDDWKGDRWDIVTYGKRGDFFNNNDLYYSVSSAYKERAVLYKLQNLGTAIRVLAITDIINADFLSPTWIVRDIPVQDNMDAKSIHQLSTDKISAYVPVDIAGLLSAGRISATAVQGKFILGLALTRGMLQWACIFGLPTLSGLSIVNGYGHVSHKGDLTGGQYPSVDCDATGFKGTIYPIDDFKDKSDDNDVSGTDEKIFISGASIWFVYAELKGIVSHLEFINGAHVPQVIPLANNYHSVREISAHKTVSIVDTLPRSLSIVDILFLSGSDDNPLTTVMSYFSGIALPALWHMMPAVLLGILSSQGLEQASYVNRNSLPVKSDDGKSDKDVSVVRDSVTINIAIDVGKFGALVALLIGIAGAVVGAVSTDNLKVDASKDANTPDDTKGRKLGAFVTRVAMDSITTAFTSEGLIFSAKTETTEILSLSMFYTINDGVECWAGPGFVNHNFIGQAVVQGVAAARFRLSRYGAYFPLKMISDLLIKVQKMALQLLSKFVHDSTDGVSGDAGGGLFVQMPFVYIASLIMRATNVAVDAVVILYQYMEESMQGLYDTLGPARGFYSGGAERNVIEPEATHSYGNKPMSMFWPAFGVDDAHRNNITTERVQSKVSWEPAEIKIGGFLNGIRIMSERHSKTNIDDNDAFFDPPKHGVIYRPFDDNIYFPRTSILASAKQEMLPSRMACVEGITNMLTTDGDIKNLQVNCVDYTFGPPPIHDYIISESYKIGVQAANGEIIAYSVDDTKLIDGPASNIVELDSFFGIASSYTAIEVKDTYDSDYLRPWAITPTCIAVNLTGFNCVQNAQVYHGFDGQFNRIVGWKGGNGLDSATFVQQYCLIVNDHFKRSNIISPSEFFGKFDGPPSLSIKTMGKDRLANQIQDLTRQKGMDINIPGEDRDLQRYSAPIHSETISTLPATIRILAPYKLHVVEGVTSLTTDVRNTQTKYKAPSSVDFNLYDTMYRATEEYIAQLTLQNGIIAVEDKTPSAGLTFIGATTKEAFFYSPATRMYYSFSGGGEIRKQDIFNRFKDIKQGRWDFVNQEVVFKCLLDDRILFDDVSGIFVGRLGDKGIEGEIYPPNATIYNERSDYKTWSMAGGLIFQGPKRCIVNRFVITDDMFDMIKQNKRRWSKLDREIWPIGRDYKWKYEDWHTDAPFTAVHGWTHNPFRAATAMLGVSEETDCLFEWELTFAWTEQVSKIFEQNEFISFNLAGELIGQGGTLLSRPTHIFLYKELFKNGYYSMRYTAKNGMGNRERLYMWGDGMCALESLSLYAKEITTRRTQPLATSQVDIQELHEQ